MNAGYSLYIKDGHANFAVRKQKKLTVLSAKDALPAAPFELSATWAGDGALTLLINGKSATAGTADGVLAKTPADGLQVGQDANDPVGDYTSPFTFDGTIDHVTVRLSDK